MMQQEPAVAVTTTDPVVASSGKRAQESLAQSDRFQCASLAVFVKRRQALFQALEAAGAGSTLQGAQACFLFPAALESLRNPDVHHSYRQESNFYYFTGFEEPGSFLVLLAGSPVPGKNHRMILFVRPRDCEKELWEGERCGTERAVEVFGADEAYEPSEMDKKLPSLLGGAETWYYRWGCADGARSSSGGFGLAVPSLMDQRVLAWLEAGRSQRMRHQAQGLPQLADPGGLVGELRIFKSPEEIAWMRQVSVVTARAHQATMQFVRPGMAESEVAAFIEYQFLKNGCDRLAYGSIVAGGANAACLHYSWNRARLQEGDLLLIDAAGEAAYYASDVTRTFPVGRTFSRQQAAVYDLVLKAQKVGIGLVKPGSSLPAIHQAVCAVLVEGFCSLGLLEAEQAGSAASAVQETISQRVKKAAHRPFYPHSTSHWLGMDVHDVGGYYGLDGKPRVLAPGMVLTIEPGFYVQQRHGAGGEGGAMATAAAGYPVMGIRIEDDILVTEDGCEVFTGAAAKEREAIEALREKAFG